MIGGIAVAGILIFVACTLGLPNLRSIFSPPLPPEVAPPFDERPTALHIRALGTLYTPMTGETLTAIQAEMSGYLATVAGYHRAICRTLQTVAFTPDEAARRNEEIWNARLALAAKLPAMDAAAIRAFDAVLCLPSIEVGCGMPQPAIASR